MAGRGKDAVLPAWMQGQVGDAAPGAPSQQVPLAQSGAVNSAGASGGQQSAPTRPEWTEHTAPDGRKYYYNARLGKSSWIKPEELLAQQSQPPAVERQTQTATPPATDWGEFTAPDGRKYYYNKVTKESRWTMPEEMKEKQAPVPVLEVQANAAPSVSQGITAALAAGTPSGQKSVPTTNVPGTAQSVRPSMPSSNIAMRPAFTGSQAPTEQIFMAPPGAIQVGPTPHYATTAEAKDAFKQLLSDVRTKASTSWDDVMRVTLQDKRYGALKTISEKKAAFNEYIQQKKKEEAEEARKQRIKARDDFYQMLDECSALINNPYFPKARNLLEHDDRWQAATSDKDKEEWFADWVEELNRKQAERQKADERKRKEAFRQFLKDDPRLIRVDTTWRKAQEKLAGEATFEALDKLGRLEVFEQHIRDLVQADREDRERTRESRRHEERRNREAFRELLNRHKDEGRFNAKSRWRELLPVLKEEPLFLAVEANSTGSRPKEMFLDVLEELEADYIAHRTTLVDTLKTFLPAIVTEDTTFDTFTQSLSQLGNEVKDVVNSVPPSSLKLYFDELAGRAKEEKKEAEKLAAEAAKKIEDAFILLVKKCNDMTVETTFEQADALLRNEADWHACPEKKRQPLFEQAIVQLKEHEERKRKGNTSSDSDDERRDKKKKHKKESKRDRKRHHRDDSSSSADDERSRRNKRHRKDKSKDQHRRSSKGTKDDDDREEGEVV